MYKKLNEYLSNLAVLNVKLHNLHWNVVGTQFMQIHQFTESLYENVFEKYDAIAELIKIRGEKPLAKVADYLKEATIEELDKDQFTTEEVLEIVKADLCKMKELATEIRNMADEAGDFVVVAEFEDHVAEYEKNLWFIKAMLTK